jgi:hypothetical protein
LVLTFFFILQKVVFESLQVHRLARDRLLSTRARYTGIQ